MNYIVRQRALLGISALFCTTLLLFSCQDSAHPVGPELDSHVVAEEAGVSASAKPTCPGNSCKPDDDEPPGGLSFALTFDESMPTIFKSDRTGDPVYRDGSERVLIFSNGGLRFDTNTSQKLEKRNDTLMFVQPPGSPHP